MANERLKLSASWRPKLEPLFDDPTMQRLREFLVNEKKSGKTIFPPSALIFSALEHTAFESTKVVILGQDPYHGPGQAHGLCFSVKPGVPPPPSLINIFAEIERDLGIAPPDHGCLTPWADQGVLLLNAVLTVEKGLAGSHQGKGWEWFTDQIVDLLNRERPHLVFMLWGSYAQAKGKLLDQRKHLVLKAPHPSPLSAHRGFIGCSHFSMANKWLQDKGLSPLDWRLPARKDLPEGP